MNADFSNFSSEVLSSEEKRLFDRQLRLPNWNQEVLKKSTVLIIGIGGLGVEVAKNLAMVGVGHLILVDMDTIEYSNLNRQILFIGAPEGSNKAIIAAERLREINPFIQISAYDCALQDLEPSLYAQADLLIAGLDSIEARQELNRRALHFRKPLIDAGTAAYNGHVYCIFPACLDCDPLREREQEDIGACTLVGKPRKPLHCVLKGQLAYEQEFGQLPSSTKLTEVRYVQKYANSLLNKNFPEETPFTIDQVIQLIDTHEPTVITINCVMASLQSQEAVKVLHHLSLDSDQKLGYLQRNYQIYNGLTGKFYEIEKPRNPKCLSCGSERTSLYRIKVTTSTSLQRIIEKLTKKKNYKIDPEFPPTIFRIDSSTGFQELDSESTIGQAGLRDYETVYIMGFEDDKNVYIQLKI
ncbi:MAG: HesA/MoeB/ThiF family protein [Candidatus Hodarchaeales archaeon]